MTEAEQEVMIYEIKKISSENLNLPCYSYMFLKSLPESKLREIYEEYKSKEAQNGIGY